MRAAVFSVCAPRLASSLPTCARYATPALFHRLWKKVMVLQRDLDLLAARYRKKGAP